MVWPQATDYNAAIQNPAVCFGDPDLRQGQAEGDLLGLPRPYAGSFADVYHVHCPDGQSWAVKCFTRPLAEGGAVLCRRYRAISAHLRQIQRPFMVDFQYLEQGICVRGSWYPLLKMRWIEGHRLNDFLSEHGDKPAVLERLMQLWLRLAQDLRQGQIGHGDLQHGNVLLVPGSRQSALALRLIDYDGLFVPALAGMAGGESGHSAYQHPRRSQEGLQGPEIDRFSHLVIYTALRALRAAGPALWQHYDTGDNLLFRAEDLARPGQSRLFAELWQGQDADVQNLAGHLLLASQRPPEETPLLCDLAFEQAARPLRSGERQQVEQVLGSAPRRTRVLTRSTLQPGSLEPVSALERPAGTAVKNTALMPAVGGRPGPAPGPTSPSIARRPVSVSRPAGQPQPVRMPLLLRPLTLAGMGLAFIACLLLVSWLLHARVEARAGKGVEESRVELAPLEDVTFEAGHERSILLCLERHGCNADLAVRVEGLPAGVSQQPCRIPADRETTPLVLSANLRAGCALQPVRVAIWQADTRLAERDLQLTVTRFHPPRLGDLAPIHLRPGEKCLLRLALDGESGLSSLRASLEGLPAEVRQHSTAAAEGASTITLELAAPEGARPVEQEVKVQLWAGSERIGEARKVHFTLQPRFSMPKLIVPDPVRLPAGGSGKLVVELERRGYPGPVTVQLEGLPEGIRVEKATVPADSRSLTLPVHARADTRPGGYSAQLVALVEEGRASSGEVKLTIDRPGPAGPSDPVPVPAPAPAAPVSKARVRGDTVRFSTVDHVVLGAAYYRGTKGKQSGCVLLLHDLARRRSEEAVRRLAEALNDRGHTVLALDFRGHGASTRVEPSFWEVGPNTVLTSYRKGKPPVQQSRQIGCEDFPPGYYPWLVHDIAAARMFLEKKHDDPDEPVNLRNLVLVGSGQGATVGTLWLDSESCRYRILSEKGEPLHWDHRPESELMAGAVWIGLDTMVGDRWLGAHLIRAGSRIPLPMVLLVGDNDEVMRDSLQPIFAALRKAQRRVGSVLQGVPVPENAAGERLQVREKTADVVCESVDRLLHIRFEIPWFKRHAVEGTYQWIIPWGARLLHFVAKRDRNPQVQLVPLRSFDIPVDNQIMIRADEDNLDRDEERLPPPLPGPQGRRP